MREPSHTMKSFPSSAMRGQHRSRRPGIRQQTTGRRSERVTVSRSVVFLTVSFTLVSPLSYHVNHVILSNMHVRQPRNFRQDYRICMIGMGNARPVPCGRGWGTQGPSLAAADGARSGIKTSFDLGIILCRAFDLSRDVKANPFPARWRRNAQPDRDEPRRSRRRRFCAFCGYTEFFSYGLRGF